MDDNSKDRKSYQQKSPIELMDAQTQSLAELVESQKILKLQNMEFMRQNERIIELLAEQESDEEDLYDTRVKIEDINMPFGALIGFMIKVSLASIPAAIILAVLFGLIALLFGSILGGIFAAISNSIK